MPRSSDDTRRRILGAAYELFYTGGYAGAGVDAIADAAAVTKRTLYYHFASKDALLAAVLDVQHELLLARFGRWAARAADEPQGFVERLFAEFAAWARQPGWRGSGFTRVAIELAGAPDHPAREAAHRHKAAFEAWIAAQLASRGVTRAAEIAREIALLIEGCNALALIHGDPAYVDAAAAAARRIVAGLPQARATGRAARQRGRSSAT
jgi:AcrR family transcriptional regulator